MSHSIVLALHLLFMNLASALPLFAIIAQYADAKNSGGDLSYARRLAKISLHSLLGGILLGLALAGLMWISGQSHFFQMLPRFAYKIYWAIGELFFFVACMLGYLKLLPARSPLPRSRHLILTTLAVLASLNLLYHFPPLFSVMHWSRVTAENVPERVGPREFRQLMLTSRYAIPMLVHFALASVAVAGVFVMYEKSKSGKADQGDDKERTAERSSGRRAAGIALAATASQFLVGPWLLLSLPHVAQYRLLGEDLVGTAALLLSLLLAFGLLHQLATSTFGDTSPREARKTALWLILITVLMTMTLGRMDAELVRTRADVSDSARAQEPIN